MSRTAKAMAPVLALALAGLAACSTGGDQSDDVVGLGQLDATVSAQLTGGDTGGDNSGEVPQKLRAEAMVSCLVDAGLPAILNEWQDEDDQADITWDGAKATMVHTASENVGMSGCYSDPCDFDNNQPGEDFTPTDDWPQRLLIDGIDYSAEYSTCWAEADFIEPVWHSDPVEDLKQKQAQVEANNTWAACARQNGYPDLKDNPAPKAEDEAWPDPILLPATITVDQIRTLIEVCPNFNEDQERRIRDDTFDWESETYLQDPYIDIDMPWRTGSGEPSEADMERYDELFLALWGHREDFWNEAKSDSESLDAG